jgi:hypothetical protein
MKPYVFTNLFDYLSIKNDASVALHKNGKGHYVKAAIKNWFMADVPAAA